MDDGGVGTRRGEKLLDIRLKETHTHTHTFTSSSIIRNISRLHCGSVMTSVTVTSFFLMVFRLHVSRLNVFNKHHLVSMETYHNVSRCKRHSVLKSKNY